MSLIGKLQSIFYDVFDDETLSLSRSTNATNIDDWNSLTHISLIVAIEKEFKIRFSIGEIPELRNVGEMLDLIETKII